MDPRYVTVPLIQKLIRSYREPIYVTISLIRKPIRSYRTYLCDRFIDSKAYLVT